MPRDAIITPEDLTGSVEHQPNPPVALECEPACIYCCGPETDEATREMRSVTDLAGMSTCRTHPVGRGSTAIFEGIATCTIS